MPIGENFLDSISSLDRACSSISFLQYSFYFSVFLMLPSGTQWYTSFVLGFCPFSFGAVLYKLLFAYEKKMGNRERWSYNNTSWFSLKLSLVSIGHFFFLLYFQEGKNYANIIKLCKREREREREIERNRKKTVNYVVYWWPHMDHIPH